MHKLCITILVIHLSHEQVSGQTTNKEESYLYSNQVIENVDEFSSIEQDLPDVSLFKTAGIWVLRGLTDNNKLFTYFNVEFVNNKVLAKYYLGKKLLLSSNLYHIKDSKMVREDIVDSQEYNKVMILYQDDKMMVSAAWGRDNNRTLYVSAKNDQSVSDDLIRSVIANYVMVKPNVRFMIEDLVSQLMFVNKNFSAMCLDSMDYGIGLFDRGVPDLTQGVRNWTINAVSDQMYKSFTSWTGAIEGHSHVARFYAGSNQVAWGFIKAGKCNMLDADLFMGAQHMQGKIAVILTQADFFAYIFWPKNGPVLLMVNSRADRPYDGQYVRKSVENHINFRPDLKRALNDDLSKLIWI